MTRIERAIVDFTGRHINVLLLLFFLIIGLAVRWVGRGYLTGDLTTYLLPWYDEIKNTGGLASLSHQVGDYGLLFQTLISLMTYIDLPSVYQYKILSVVFDIALAFTVGYVCREELILRKQTDSKLGGVISAALTFLLPTVFIDSAFWGQCDSMYSVFCVATLYFLSKDSFKKAFLFLGLAFACKLQSVFILPFIIAYYLKSRKFTLLYFLLTIAVVWASGAVAFLYGRNLLAPFTIYHAQTYEYTHVFMNFPSFWMLTGDNYAALKYPAILLTLALLTYGCIIFCKDKRATIAVYYPYAVWFVWTMVLFLPSMHERYSYLLDILLILSACLDWRCIKYAIVSCCISLYTYSNYIFMRDEKDKAMMVVAVIFLTIYAHYSYNLLTPINNNNKVSLKKENL